MKILKFRNQPQWILSVVMAMIVVPVGYANQASPLDIAIVGKPSVPVHVKGDVSFPAEASVGGNSATLIFGDSNSIDYRINMQVQLGLKGGIDLFLFPSNEANLDHASGMCRVHIAPDTVGLKYLTTTTYRFDAEAGKWVADGNSRTDFNYQPIDEEAVANIDNGIWPEGVRGRWIDFSIDVTSLRFVLWIDGMVAQAVDLQPERRGKVLMRMGSEDRFRQITISAIADKGLFVPIDMTHHVNDMFKTPVGNPTVKLDGVTFNLVMGRQDHMSLLKARWVDQKRDPQSYYEAYDGGPYYIGDPRMPFLRVPKDDYVAVHLLTVAEDDPNMTNIVTIRAGRYGGGASQVLLEDFSAEVPRSKDANSVDSSQYLGTPSGPLFHVRVPLDRAFSQDIAAGYIEMEMTKELYLARHCPDPSRYRYRPLGLPSGVRIAAITLELSPLQMRVTSNEAGHAFVEPNMPEFIIQLHNITDIEQSFTLQTQSTHLYGGIGRTEKAGMVAAGQTIDVVLPVETVKRGYHELVIALLDGKGNILIKRQTSFALLMPDTRKYRDQSPFGTWSFGGTHFTSKDTAEIGSLFRKLGFRYGMSNPLPEVRAKYGILPGFEAKVQGQGGLEQYEKQVADGGVRSDIALIFHEDSISAPHVTRIPDLFHDRPPYKLDETEMQRYEEMFKQAVDGAKAMREKYPKVSLEFGNGPLTTKEEFYRRGFPAELFDAGGNEPSSFARLPEVQPPDFIGFNSSIWMDRQLLDAYGYKNKPVRQCYEIGYPGDNPGNLTSAAQASYYIRLMLHSLAWEMPFIHIGGIMDAGNSYYFSNWGASGFCKAYPEMNVKPSYSAIATLTNVLDGAKLFRIHDMGSMSIYGIEFERHDGNHVLAAWTIRGQRPVMLTFDGGPWTVVDDQGNASSLAATNTITLSASPCWLVGKGRILTVKPGTPIYNDSPATNATVIDSLASLDKWQVDSQRNAELEVYNFMTPRRKGDFAFNAVKSFEGKDHVLRVTPKPIKYGKSTMPMYAVLAHSQGIAMPGEPTEIGLWVNGNSGWGRIIFEFEDASGQRWISIGAQAGSKPNSWLMDWMPKEVINKVEKSAINDWNTDDCYGQSSINFDGWRYLCFPLPGNYLYENHPWPANSNWRWDKDGVVHYPLKFRKLIVELRDKALHLKTFTPVVRPEIYMCDLTVSADDRYKSVRSRDVQ